MPEYASRNAAFQAAVAAASGTVLTLDGDLVVPDGNRGQVGATEAAVRSLGPQLGLGDAAIRRALEQGDRQSFERTELYHARLRHGRAQEPGGRCRAPSYPRIDLRSPKITRKLTTEWFANRVQQRYERCLGKEAIVQR